MKKTLSVLTFALVLIKISFAQTQDMVNAQMMRNDFGNFARAEDTRFMSGSSLPNFTPRQETVGSRYLFDKWVHGVVVSVADSVYSDPNALFNYNKVAGTLIMTKDQKTALELYLTRIKSFTLTDDVTYQFIRVPAISDKDFVVALVKNDGKYSLYKQIKTKFIAANYVTNGIAESGNQYDEFRDQPTYYIGLPGGKDIKKVDLKKKSIKSAISGDDAKVDKYFADHSSGEVDELFLIGLVNNLNQ